MLACRIHAKEDLRVEPMAAPSPGPGEVLLRGYHVMQGYFEAVSYTHLTLPTSDLV